MKKITRKGSYTFFRYISLSKYFKIFFFVVRHTTWHENSSYILVTAGKVIFKKSYSGRLHQQVKLDITWQFLQYNENKIWGSKTSGLWI